MNYVEPIYADYLDLIGAEEAVPAVAAVYPKPDPVPTPEEEQARLWRLVELYWRS